MRSMKENFAKVLFTAAAAISIIAAAVICIFLFANGIPAIQQIGLLDFLGGSVWKPTADVYGILPMILGSIYATAGALAIGVPIGLLCAIYLSKYASPRMRKVITPGVELLAGIPSVIYGFFGLVVIVPLIRTAFGVQGMSLLAAMIILGIMILPTIITLSVSAIDAVPENYYEGARALGADHTRSIFRVMVPAAKSGIMAGVVLGVGRAIGETMAVVMIAGNQAVIPNSLLAGVRTLTSNVVLEMGYAVDLHRDALIATAVVLFVFVLIINIAFSVLKARSNRI